MDTQNQPIGSKSNKKFAIIIVIIIVLALGAWYFLKGSATTGEQTGEEVAPAEEAQAVNEELNGIDVGDTNQELESIDQDLNNL